MQTAKPLCGAMLRTQGMNLVDDQGRRVFLSGINLVHKGTRMRPAAALTFTRTGMKTSTKGLRTWA